MPNRIPIGTRIGALTVLGPAPKGADGRSCCHVQCRCSRVLVVRSSALGIHGTKSCGRKQCRGQPIEWTADTLAAMEALAAIPGTTYGQIAKRLGKTRSAVFNKMEAMGIVAETSTPAKVRQGVENYPGRCFEDHPDAESDRRVGRKPQRQYAQSMVGCSAAMACK